MVLRLFASSLLFIRRKVGLYGLAALALLYAGIFVVTLNLTNLVRGLGEELNWLGQISFAALCFGWWGGNPWRKTWLIWLASFFFGVFVVVEHAGNLWPSLFAVLRAVFFLGWSLLDQTVSEIPAWLALALSWHVWVSELSDVFVPVGLWLHGLIVGETAYNQTVTFLLWSSVIGYLAFWSGWALRRLNHPLLAMLPAGVMLAGSFSYVREDEYIALAGFAGIILLLMGLHQQYTQEQQWQKKHVDYADDLRLDALLASGGISVLVVVIAVIVPIINIRQMIDFFRTPPVSSGSPESAQVGEALGLDVPQPPLSPYQRLADGGLPRLHLLGTGPELSEQIVMIVEVDDPAAAPQRYYWRSLTYDTYTGQGWLTGDTTSIPYREGVTALPSLQPFQRVVRQHVRLTDDLGKFIFSAGDIRTLDWPFSIAWRTPAEGEPRTDQFAGRVEQTDYQVDVLMPIYTASQLQVISTPLPDWVRERYLALPESIPPRVFEMAAGVTIAQPTAFDRAVALERFLRSFTYSLELPSPPTDQDIVDYFLFDLRRGYCDYYATAMVVLARASGLPARLAVGYASGEYDVVNHRYLVTAADAHSWVEIYFSGVGWVPFEPTSSRPEIIRTEAQTEVAALNLPPPAPFEPVWLRTARQVGWGVAGVILLGMAGFVGWNLWETWRLRHLSPDEMVMRLFVRLYPIGEKLAVSTLPGATPYEYAEAFFSRLEEIARRKRWLSLAQGEVWHLTHEIRSLTEYFVRAVYAPMPLTEAARGEAITLWRDLRWRLWWVRVRLRLIEFRIRR